MKIATDNIVTIKSEKKNQGETSYTYELRSFEGHSVASFGIILYEISVEMNCNGEISFYRTGGLFSDREKAIKFFNMISNRLATPRNMPYIIEDAFSF